jgi:hypothetical protein
MIDQKQQAAASKGVHVDKLLASWRRKVSLAVHVAHADNVLRGLSATTAWRLLLPRLGCLLMSRRSSPAPWAASVPVLPRAAGEAPLIASTCCILGVA